MRMVIQQFERKKEGKLKCKVNVSISMLNLNEMKRVVCLLNASERKRDRETHRVRNTLVDEVKASSRLATLRIEPQHDLIGSCQWQCLSWKEQLHTHEDLKNECQ